MEVSLNEKLEEYALKNPLRMHMPGHKGKEDSCVKNAQVDITEISGFDNLHNPKGVIQESQQLASKLWGSGKSFYLVNGSTCGILAGIRAITRRGDEVLVARNCHKAVYHALELCGLQGVFVMPRLIEEWNVFGSVSPEDVKQALDDNSGISLVVITSPTYEGVISDIEEICRIAHSKGVKVLVDEAHGAHLSLDSYFEKSSVLLGADIVVQSLHKTLDCPTQTAIMHIGEGIDEVLVRHELSVFETSSPSYILMSGIDSFVRKTSSDKSVLKKWTCALDEFYKKISCLENIEILAAETDKDIFSYDKSKIVFRCSDTSALAEKLRNGYNVELEAVNADFAIAMSGAGDDSITLGKFADILIREDGNFQKLQQLKRPFLYSTPTVVKKAEKVLSEKQQLVSPKEGVGKICGEYIWEYPPGIPVLIPGEIITETFLKIVENDKDGRLCSQRGTLPDKIAISDENV